MAHVAEYPTWLDAMDAAQRCHSATGWRYRVWRGAGGVWQVTRAGRWKARRA